VIYLVLSTFKQWYNPTNDFNDKSVSSKVNLFHGAVLNILSPGLYLYWTLVNGPLLISALQESLIHGLAFLIGFYCFFIGGMLIIAALFAQTRRLGEKFIKSMLLISTIILFAFGILLIWRSLSHYFL
jgi:threonine/homoserine/homoserine lactone efflux protein